LRWSFSIPERSRIWDAFFHLVTLCAPIFDTLGFGRQRPEEWTYGLEPDSPDRAALGGVQPVGLTMVHNAYGFDSIPFYGLFRLFRLVPFVGCADLHQSSVSQRVF
jgi:hypothetical protein